MRYETIGLLKRAFIQQKIDALARRQLAFFVLALAPLLPSSCFGGCFAPLQVIELLFEVHAFVAVSPKERRPLPRERNPYLCR